MIFKLIIEDGGEYLNRDNQECALLSAENYIDTPDGRNVGCIELESIEAAEKYFDISKIGISNEDAENVIV